MPLDFVLSQRGKRQLMHNGYVYNVLRECKSKIQWRCIEYGSSTKCRAIAETTTISKSGTILREDEHPNHAPDVGKLQAKRIIARAKKQVTNTQVSTSQVIQDGLKKASTSAIAELPGISSLTRTLTRARALANPVFQTPESREALDVPEAYTKTHTNENFLYYDYGKKTDRFLMFATERNLDALSKCGTWLCDGTFLTVPTIFSQLYTIHGIIHGKTLPLIYVLAPNKTERTYKRILSHIKSSREQMQPDLIISDFELAFINAAEKAFPESEIHGCFFHFGQCVYRHVQGLGYAHQYGNDKAFNLNIRMLIALAFVPIDDVCTAFDTLLSSGYFQDNQDHLKLIIDYFVVTWVGKAQKRGRRWSPKFSIHLWNCFEAVMNNIPRTNNSVEAWHNAFNSRIQSAHASMGKFINALKGEQSTTEAVLEQQNAGRDIGNKKRRKYRNYDERLKNVVASYSKDIDIIDYLRGTAHNIKL